MAGEKKEIIREWIAENFIHIPWKNPCKIERQSLLNVIILSANYAKGTMLDIGCGTKPYESIFANRVSHHWGLDLPSTASKSYGDLTRTDIYANCLEIPIKSESVDTILSTEVLEHLPEPLKMLQEAHRSLKKGGYLILTAPMVWGLHEEPFDFFRYTQFGLQYLIEKAGFNIVTINARGGIFSVLGQIVLDHIAVRCGKKGRVLNLFELIITYAINRIATFMDHLFPSGRITLGYFVIAQKI